MKNFLFDIVVELSKRGVDFVVCGGVACVLQGCERTTFDVDLNLHMSPVNLKKAVEVFRAMKYSPRIPEPVEFLFDEDVRSKWVSEKDALVYTFVSGTGQVQVDVFLRYPVGYDDLKKNADVFSIDGHDIMVSSKKDLIAAKESVHPLRDKDIYDISELRKLEAADEKRK